MSVYTYDAYRMPAKIAAKMARELLPEFEPSVTICDDGSAILEYTEWQGSPDPDLPDCIWESPFFQHVSDSGDGGECVIENDRAKKEWQREVLLSVGPGGGLYPSWHITGKHISCDKFLKKY